MGCSKSSRLNFKSETVFKLLVKEAIDLDNSKSLLLIYKKYNQINPKDETYLDRPITRVNFKNLNALAYCMHIGNYSIFKSLLQLGASIQEMNKLLEDQGLRAINMICSKNHSKFLENYFPIYISTRLPTNDKISFKFEIPLHTAIRVGAIETITTIHSLSNNDPKFEEFLFGTKDEKGENAAHKACRFGNYNIVKLLHTKFDADYSVLNEKKENCLVIAADGYKACPNLNFLNVFKYLIECIGLDVTYMCEDLLLKIENEEILLYLEKKLLEKGIEVSRNELIKCSFTMKGLSVASYKHLENSEKNQLP